MKTVLFDLDGTLLPMEQNTFVHTYLECLADYAVPYGFEKETLIPAIWQATGAMIANDGSMTNEQRFWKTFHELTGRGDAADQKMFLRFYETGFAGIKKSCGYNPEANRLVKALRRAGHDVILATNPLFPRPATLERVRWAGLDASDFRMITTYEDCTSCKPSPSYFEAILHRSGCLASECRMVGNDAVEDGAAEEAGIRTFLITDHLENGREEELRLPHGSFTEVRSWLGLGC